MLGNIFLSIYRFLKPRRFILFTCLMVLLGYCVYTCTQIQYVNKLGDILPQKEGLTALSTLTEYSDVRNKFFVLINSSKGLPKDVAQSIKEDVDSGLNGAVRYIGNDMDEQKADILSVLSNHTAIYQDPSHYDQLYRFLTNTDSLTEKLVADKALLLSPAGVGYKTIWQNDPFGLLNAIWTKVAQANNGQQFDNVDGYWVLSDSTIVLPYTLIGDLNNQSKKVLKWLEAYSSQKADSDANIITYFGVPLVSAANALQLERDTYLTLSLTIIGIGLLLWFYFKWRRAPFLLFLPVMIGIAIGLMLTYWVNGQIALMALGAGAVILGVAIDFSLHFLTHFKHTLSVEVTIQSLAQPLTIGSLTTILAFWALRFTNSPILIDFGTFAAFSLLGAALATLIVLPHCVRKVKQSKASPSFVDSWAAIPIEKSKAAVVVVLAVSLVCLFLMDKVSFDGNLSNLNYRTPALIKGEQQFNSLSGDATKLFFIAQSNNFDIAAQLIESNKSNMSEAAEKEWISNLSSPTDLIPSKALQMQRVTAWKRFWTEDKIRTVQSTLQQAADSAGMNADFLQAKFQTIVEQVQTLDSAEQQQLAALYPTGLAINEGQYFVAAYADVAIKNRQDVLDLGFKDLTVIDNRSGIEQLVQLISDDFNAIAKYTMFIVFAALLLAYGRIELALISFVPMMLTWVVLLGLMALFGIEFNMVNTILSTLVFGLGDDYSIFTTDALVEAYKHKKERLSKTRSAILLSALTTCIGMGVLIFAEHPALKSIAIIAVLGILSVLIVSQTLQPFLFNWFIKNRADKGFMPFTLHGFVFSVFAFGYFVLGSIIVTVIGLLCVILKRIVPKYSKRLLHSAMQFFTGSLLYIMMNTRKNIIKKGRFQFNQTPAVYIANHASFLDILMVVMLHPRLILLTNNWVWKSPVFGKIVQMADYFPVKEGIENGKERMKALVEKGYSIVVFPEGTRSYTDKIGRFKKGAFYLADTLQIPVKPILLHGLHYTMSKGDWLLKNGQMTAILYNEDVCKSIPSHLYLQKSKAYAKWFRKSLDETKQRIETPKYFKEQLFNSYIYKGPIIEWYCRIKTKLEGYYEWQHAQLPKEGLIYDLGCGYGFMVHMLSWAAPKRRLMGVDYDEGKVSVGQHIYSKSTQVTLEHGDLTTYVLEPCEGIVINDVLHYLPKNEQVILLQKAAMALKPGGVLIVRDGVVDKQGIKGTRLTEFFSVKLLGFNKSPHQHTFISVSEMKTFGIANGMDLEIIDQAQFTSNLTFVFKKYT